MRTGSKPLALEHKPAHADNKIRSTSVGVESPVETFYSQLEEALNEVLSPSEINSFIREMKKVIVLVIELCGSFYSFIFNCRIRRMWWTQ